MLGTKILGGSAVLLAGLISFGGVAAAQGLAIGGNSSNFGNTRLSPGFSPDPRTVSNNSGGTLRVNDMGLGSDCVGYATRQPDYIVHLSGQSSMLRFYNIAQSGDTALVINAGNGSWHCNDDSHGGTNPTVSIRNAPAGQYDIWITSYNSGEQLTGTLHITERADHHAGSAGGGGGGGGNGQLSIGGSESNFGSVRLASGFTPDPRRVNNNSGGTLRVQDMNLGSDCVGHATRQPDYIVHLTDASSMLRFYNIANGGDTALVINGADGQWHCNDDSFSTHHPTVSIQNAQAGQYDVWITSYNSGEQLRGRLHITELSNKHPN